MTWDSKSTNLYFRFELPRELHKQFKVKAVQLDTTMAELLIKLIQDFLEKDTNQ